MPITTVAQRMAKYIEPEPNTGCWLWSGCVGGGGYGMLRVDGVARYAHRISYELRHGPIADGLQVDHLCRVRCCVNPDHLEPVTQRENLLRGVGFAATNAEKDFCKRGHPLTPDNLYRSPSQPTWRFCRECIRLTARERYRAKRRQAA